MRIDELTDLIAELQSIAQAGLFYGKDVYDRERYQRIREIAAEMLAMKTETTTGKISDLFCLDYGYQTPKVDTRAAVFQEGKILLVHEKNGTWSLPGGWCEATISPVDNTIKETKEEAGLDVRILSVISVQDRDHHNLPPYVYGVVKIFYLCEKISGVFTENIETSESAYFGEDELPALAPEKCNEEQVHMCFAAYRNKDWKTQFD